MSTLGIQKCDLWNFDETPYKLEEYTHADIDERVVLTFTDTGYNNSHRAIQWLQHFNRCSFAASETFAGSSIEEWFGYPTTITKSQFDEEYAFKPRYQVKKAPTSYRLLLMDSFSAHEDPEFIWRLWIEADEEKRDFQYRIWGRHVLEAIPEAADYLADLDKAAALREAAALRGQLDNIPEDVLSVSSGDLTPLLLGNEEEDCDDIEVIMNTQIEGFTQAALAAGRGDYSPENSDQEEDLSRREDWGGFGYDRLPNNYSDDERVEACIVVAGMTIPVPPSRARD
ncbi:hypothetical protein NW754_008056 [Fusarium falciforme]|nr:hypothetical protein NW754_008056 [Fusarium falciforme]